jgi:hypothetical protein
MIQVQISDFAGKYVALNNPSQNLPVSRLMLARSVMTVGQAGIRQVLGLGLFRLAELFCTTLANTKVVAGSLTLDDSFAHLEQSEQVGISYRLGMGLAKASAEIVLQIPWLLHLDRVPGVLLSATNNRLPSKLTLHNKSKPADRPDLIGFDSHIRPHVFEAKGRSSGIQPLELQHAIDQVSQVETINGSSPETRVVSFFDTSKCPMFGRIIDPDENAARIDGWSLKIDPFQAINTHYSFISDDIEQWSSAHAIQLLGRTFVVRALGTPDYCFGIDADVFEMIRSAKYTLQQVEEIPKVFQHINNLSVKSEGVSIGLDGTFLGSARGGGQRFLS